MSQADRIRYYVISELIEPARAAGRGHIIVCSGDVHQALGLQNRLLAVCSALDAAIFEEQRASRSFPAAARTKVQLWSGGCVWNRFI